MKIEDVFDKEDSLFIKDSLTNYFRRMKRKY
jgi:hypothetical protein